MRFKTAAGFEALQYADELVPFVELIRKEGVRRYLEIGTCRGGTFHRIMTSLRPCGYGIAVDLPRARWGKPDSERHLRNVIRDLKRRHINASVVWGNSQAPETIAAVAERAPFDAVFIDGDHTYDGAQSDWLAYGPLARIVAFHDIAAIGLGIEVPRLWAELKATRRHVEIIGREPGMGIGVLWNA
jgi:hypothetical protein